jgi:hypothetical protein
MFGWDTLVVLFLLLAVASSTFDFTEVVILDETPFTIDNGSP